jgi:hypothetical protein
MSAASPPFCASTIRPTPSRPPRWPPTCPGWRPPAGRRAAAANAAAARATRRWRRFPSIQSPPLTGPRDDGTTPASRTTTAGDGRAMAVRCRGRRASSRRLLAGRRASTPNARARKPPRLARRRLASAGAERMKRRRIRRRPPGRTLRRPRPQTRSRSRRLARRLKRLRRASRSRLDGRARPGGGTPTTLVTNDAGRTAMDNITHADPRRGLDRARGPEHGDRGIGPVVASSAGRPGRRRAGRPRSRPPTSTASTWPSRWRRRRLPTSPICWCRSCSAAAATTRLCERHAAREAVRRGARPKQSHPASRYNVSAMARAAE